MMHGKKLLLIGILMVGSIGCDQTTKHLAITVLDAAVVHSYFHDVVRLQYAENPGGMMSFGAELPESVRFWFLTVFVGLVLLGILIYLLFSQSNSSWQTASLTLIVAGGLSNLLDRLLHNGHVIDFLNVGIGGIRTAIFNFADVIILLGACMLLFTSANPRRRETVGNGTNQN